jgi:hypothetical protein
MLVTSTLSSNPRSSKANQNAQCRDRCLALTDHFSRVFKITISGIEVTLLEYLEFSLINRMNGMSKTIVVLALSLLSQSIFASVCGDTDGSYEYVSDEKYIDFLESHYTPDLIDDTFGEYGSSFLPPTLPPAAIDAICMFYNDFPQGELDELPAALSGLIASVGDFTDEVLLTWDAASGAALYEVYEALTQNGELNFIGITAMTAMSVADATPENTYFYVYPVNAAGAGFGQWEAAYEALAPGNIAPVASISGGDRIIADTDNAPGELVSFDATATYIDESIASLKWKVDGSLVASGFSVELSLVDGISGVTVEIVDNQGLSMTKTVNIRVEAPILSDGWPAPYNGVTPIIDLESGFNNIGVYSAEDERIYSCLRIFTGGLPSSIDGVSSFDIAFKVVSVGDGIIAVEKTRPFNINFAQNEKGEDPACSGIFDTDSSLFTDIIQVGEQVLSVTFELLDGENLELILRDVAEM